MSLNIKNERVHDLARRAARLTGKSQTAAIEEALVRFLDARGTDPETARQQRIDVLWTEIALETSDADREATRETMADLYDDAGLPR